MCPKGAAAVMGAILCAGGCSSVEESRPTVLDSSLEDTGPSRGDVSEDTGAADLGFVPELGVEDVGEDTGTAEDVGDDGGTMDDATTPDAEPMDAGVVGPPQRIFVTSSTFAASLANLPGGIDGPCQGAADAADLGGTWTTLISVGAVAAPDRVGGTGPLVDVAGTVVVNDRSTFDPVQPLQLDENGVVTFFKLVWTGTNGLDLQPSGNDCDQWSNSTSDVQGTAGLTGESDGNWIERTTLTCDAVARLFCVEQIEP